MFARVPFGREGSKEFFSLVKNNEKQAVSLMLRRDKYLVYTYDYVKQQILIGLELFLFVKGHVHTITMGLQEKIL